MIRYLQEADTLRRQGRPERMILLDVSHSILVRTALSVHPPRQDTVSVKLRHDY